jgi:hypothetical protein
MPTPIEDSPHDITASFIEAMNPAPAAAPASAPAPAQVGAQPITAPPAPAPAPAVAAPLPDHVDPQVMPGLAAADAAVMNQLQPQAPGAPATLPTAEPGLAGFLQAPAAAAAPGEWNADEWIRGLIPDPAGLNGDANAAFAQLREAVKAAAVENQALRNADPQGTLRKGIEAEMTAKYADHEALKAQNAIWNSEEFTEKYRAPILRLREEQRSILRQSGLAPELADEAASQVGEYAQAAFWRSKVTDTLALDLLTRKGTDMTARMEAMKDEMKNPLDHLEAFQTASTARETSRMAEQTQVSKERALSLHTQLAAGAAEGNPVYGTPHGRQLLNDIASEYAQNTPLSDEQLVGERIAARSVPILTRYVAHLEAQLQATAGKVQQYQNLEPNPTPGAAPAQQGSTLVDLPNLMSGQTNSGGLFKAGATGA